MLRKLFIDIETKDERDGERYFAEPTIADEPVLCVTLYDNFNKLYISLMWRPVEKSFKVKTGEWWTYVFTSEKDMLRKLVDTITMFGPDLIIGFNHKNYDIPYLLKRWDIYNINYSQISPFGTFYNKDNRIITRGVMLFDIREAYKKIQRHKLRRYSLEYIASREGMSKIKFDGSFYNLWRTNYKKMLNYNRKDVELLVHLDRNLGLVEHFDSIARMAGCSIDDAFWNSKVAEKYFLRNGKYILPNKPPYDADKVPDFEGGFVKRPQIGVHNNVIVFDFRRLYPTIIVSFNMSPETLVDEPGEDTIDLPCGVSFRKDVKGILPQMLEELFSLRDKYKNLMKNEKHGSKEWVHYDRLQFVTKCLINSFYGYLSYKRSRILFLDIGKAIPYMGRLAIQNMASIMEYMGIKVLYADTDSVFVQGKGETYGELKEEADSLLVDINKKFSEFPKEYGGKNIFFMDFKHIDKTVFWGDAKKRYAEMRYTDDGKDTEMEVIGLEFIRSDWSEITARVQKEVLNRILSGYSKESIFKYVKEEKEKLRHAPIWDVFPTRSITKPMDQYKVNSNHIKSAKWSNKNAGTNFKAGDKGLLIWVKSTAPLPPPEKNNDKTRTILWDKETIPTWCKVDWKTVEEKVLDAPLERIFEALRWRSMGLKPLTEWCK
jgi:DNA polymerase elongation subunit (family B)